MRLRSQEEIPEQEPLQLCLTFSGGGEVAILCSSDGESIRVGRHPYTSLPEEDEDYEMVRQDQTDGPQWMVFVGNRCEDIVEVRDHSFGGKGIWVGLELLFDGGAVLTAYNWGDALQTSAPPEETGFLERTSLRERFAQEEAREASRKKSEDGEKSEPPPAESSGSPDPSPEASPES